MAEQDYMAVGDDKVLVIKIRDSHLLIVAGFNLSASAVSLKGWSREGLLERIREVR